MTYRLYFHAFAFGMIVTASCLDYFSGQDGWFNWAVNIVLILGSAYLWWDEIRNPRLYI